VKRGFKSQCEKRAIELRKQLGLESTSPLSATELSDQVNVTIWSTLDIDGLGLQDLRQLTEIDADSWSAFTLRIENKHLVVYNSSQSPARINSVCMHELSHIILGHELHNAHVSSEGHLVPSNYNKEQEDEADWLGGTLLLPRPALLEIRSLKLTDDEAEARYCVSTDMIRWRFRMTGVDYQLSNRRRR